MAFFEAIRLALRMIWAQKLKSSFSIVGVFIGVMFLIAVVTMVEGMNKYMLDAFSTQLGANTFHLRRFPNFDVGETTRETRREWNRRPGISYADAEAVVAAITIPVVSSWVSYGRGEVEFRDLTVQRVSIVGATEDYFEVRNLGIEEGRVFSQQEVVAGRAVAVIGKELSDRLFGDLDPLGRDIQIRSIPYRIIGVAETRGNIFGESLDKFVVAPALSPVKRFVAPRNEVGILMIKADTEAEMRAAMIEAEAVMRSRRGLRPAQDNNFVLETGDAFLEFWAKINRFLALALPGFVGISLVVGGIVIMNIMLMSVTERTAEIGIRKALGATRSDILRQFLIESAALAVIGAGLGIAAGLAIAVLIEAATPMPASVAPWSLVVAVAMGAGVGIGAGLYPANRAAKMDPVYAMGHD
ncbi:MAG: ABC transporter permease [Gemmatimonadetes bacterium]|nr:ABC transporter permease [Gemmatimonadota bacterium]